MKHYTHAIARAFSHHLHNETSALALWQIDQLNATEDPSVDHAHDHCDANELLAAAFHEVTGEEFNPQDPQHADTWEAVWRHCREVGYVRLYVETTEETPAAPVVDRLPAFLEWMLSEKVLATPFRLCERKEIGGMKRYGMVSGPHPANRIIEAFTRATS